MADLFALLSPVQFIAVCAIAFLAGLVKGSIGFALPTIMISGLSSILSPDLALAGLILSTVVTNAWQALAQGWRAALESIRDFRVFVAFMVVALALTAQLVTRLPAQVLLWVIGVPVTVFATLQLAGWVVTVSHRRATLDAGVGAFAGAMAGLAGIWGPPTVLYLTALGTPKYAQMRIQGAIYGVGALMLLSAHSVSGLLNAETLPLSLALVLPALAGMACGGLVLRRINQAQFRRMTLLVLVIAGLNLIRRALVA